MNEVIITLQCVVLHNLWVMMMRVRPANLELMSLLMVSWLMGSRKESNSSSTTTCGSFSSNLHRTFQSNQCISTFTYKFTQQTSNMLINVYLAMASFCFSPPESMWPLWPRWESKRCGSELIRPPRPTHLQTFISSSSNVINERSSQHEERTRTLLIGRLMKGTHLRHRLWPTEGYF